MKGGHIEFHIHDDTSNCNGFADSCTNYKEYIKLAQKQNMKAIAFSNHGGIYDWVRKKQDCDKAGIKYIHGVELYVCTKLEANERGYHIGLYAKNLEGVKELNDLVSLATSKGVKKDNSDRHFYYNPRISLEELMGTSDNIIITTACMASMLWRPRSIRYSLKKLIKKVRKINYINDKFSYNTKHEKRLIILQEYKERLMDQIINNKDNFKYISEYKNVFLKWMFKNNHRCFLEIQHHNCSNQKSYNKLLWRWSNKYNIPLIAGTDTHSSTKYKAECRKILQKSKDSYYGEEDEFDLTWKTYEELVGAFKIQNALPEEVYLEAIENTNKFADMIEHFELNYSFKYPNLYGDNARELWKGTILDKFNKKIHNKIIDKDRANEYKEKIKEEFKAMAKQSMESFMLFMSELVDYCNENNIPYGFCRGSVGGSMIAYITDITDVDPIIWGTVFSRFCNADRVSLADIDIDFAPEDRDKVYKYIIERFTPKKTAYIAQFGTLKDRGTIDALTKGLDYEDLELVKQIKNEYEIIFDEYHRIIQEEVNLEELEEIEARSVDFDYHDIYAERINNQSSRDRAYKLIEEFEKLKDSNKDLFYYFDGLKGTIISKGNHPAGMIGSPITLQDNLGVFYKDGDINKPVCTCAMKAVDSLNYVKFDILGLKTLGILKDTYEYIGSHYLKSHEIDWNDNKVWDNMTTSNVGVFQFEGSYAFGLLEQFKPRKINDMSLVNAALRPSGKSYRKGLIGGYFHQNPSKEIDELLKDNYGYLVYQEDTIKFLTDICGFSGSEADTLRRAIGKKDHEALMSNLPEILEGYCRVSSKPREIAEQEAKEFIQIIQDSSEYQFGLNHSTGYSNIGYACVRQRTYHGLEFTTAYLNRADNEQDIHNGHKLASLLSIGLNPIKFRYSKAKYMFDKKTNSIYKGIESIKYMNGRVADELYELRNNKYGNFLDLLIDLSKKTSINARQLNILILLDFFDEFGNNGMLMTISEIFNELHNKKQFKKEKVEKLKYNHKVFKKNSRETEKTYMEIDWYKIASELCKDIEDKRVPIAKQIQMETDILGEIQLTIPQAPDNVYVVLELKTTRYSPMAKLHNIKTGSQESLWVSDKSSFVDNPFRKLDVIKIIDRTKKSLKDWNIIIKKMRG